MPLENPLTPHLIILFCFLHSTTLGTISRDREAVVRLGLSAEEVGLLLHQLPQQQSVEMVRQPTANEALYDGPSAPQKVCKIVPTAGLAMVEFTLDFEVGGVGGQAMQNGIKGPYSVTMQAGEVQVALEIMRSSLPLLVGWTSMMDIAIQKSINDAINSGGGGNPLPDPFPF